MPYDLGGCPPLSSFNLNFEAKSFNMNVVKITIFCYNKSYLKVGVDNANILLLRCLLYLSLFNIVALIVFTCMSYNDKIERFTFKNLTYWTVYIQMSANIQTIHLKG